ncbi:MAG: DUF6624 domain-containing protein [Patescibacteria group bacterium]
MDKSQINQKLGGILEKDQKMIRQFRAGKITREEIVANNEENLRYIKTVLTQITFPFLDSFSLEAYQATVLVPLHSGDIPLMQNVVDVLSKADSKQVVKKDIAYLIDKMRVLQNQPQLYGTQFKKSETGKIVFFEIEDIENIDKRRSEINMETFEEYKKKIKNY